MLRPFRISETRCVSLAWNATNPTKSTPSLSGVTTVSKTVLPLQRGTQPIQRKVSKCVKRQTFFGFHEYLGTTNIKAGAFAFHAVPMNLYLFVQMDCDSKSGAPKNPFLSCKWHHFNFSLFRGPLQCWSPVAAPGHRWHRLRPIWHMAGAKTQTFAARPCRLAVGMFWEASWTSWTSAMSATLSLY